MAVLKKKSSMEVPISILKMSRDDNICLHDNKPVYTTLE